jgi:cytochrome c553
MKNILVACLVLPLAQTVASAQIAGDAAAGKAYWDREAPRLTDCKDCHGLNGARPLPKRRPPPLSSSSWATTSITSR